MDSISQSNPTRLCMMLIEDGGSSHTEGYFLDAKVTETTLAAFSHYHVTAECQTGWKLKRVRTDVGPEWVNELWVAYFEKPPGQGTARDICEIWYKTKPDMLHLRAFGCIAYAKIPKKQC